MSDVTHICQKHDIKTDSFTGQDASDVKLLWVFKNIIPIQKDIKDFNAEIDRLLEPKSRSISRNAKRKIKKIFRKYKDRKDIKSSKIFEEIKNLVAANKNDFIKLASIVGTAKTIEDKIDKATAPLSTISIKNPVERKRYLIAFGEIRKIGKPSIKIQEAIKLVKSFISSGFKASISRAKNPSSIGEDIKEICHRHPPKAKPRKIVVIKPKIVKPKIVKLVKKPKVEKPKERTLLPAQLDASGRVGSGYGFAFAPKDKNNPRILADLERGVLAQGGISLMWKILQEKHALQLDYLTSVPFKKKDDAASMLDFTSLSYLSHPIKSLDFFAQAAYLFYKNDHPSERVEDKLDAFAGRLRLHYRPPIKKFTLSIDYDQNILAGRTNQILPEEKRTVLRTIGQLGPSFTFEHKGSKTTAFLGGVVGWNNKEGWKEEKAKGTVYGGYAGAAFLLGNHEANLRFDYNNLFGMETMVRYFHDAPRWGIGGRLFYNFYSKKLNDAEADQHILGAAIAAKIIMFKIRKLPIGIWLEAQGAYETETDNASLVLLATLKIGGLRFALPTRYRPNSLETPAEGK